MDQKATVTVKALGRWAQTLLARMHTSSLRGIDQAWPAIRQNFYYSLYLNKNNIKSKEVRTVFHHFSSVSSHLNLKIARYLGALKTHLKSFVRFCLTLKTFFFLHTLPYPHPEPRLMRRWVTKTIQSPAETTNLSPPFMANQSKG